MNSSSCSRSVNGIGIARSIFGDMECKKTFPEMDAIEREDLFLFKFSIPGMKKEEIKISIEDNNILSISGEKKNEIENEQLVNIPIQERFYGSFSRSILIPEDIVIENVKASYKEGVLEIIIPKAKKEPYVSLIKID
jgi:HSP20 family protein